jgi:AcrR family transcriptional regulator
MAPMNAELVTSRSSARDSIVSQLAAVLRNSAGTTTNIESAITSTHVSPQDIAANFGGNRELLLAMVRELSESMCAPLDSDALKLDLRQRLFEFGQRVTDTYASSHLRSLYRIAITESIRHTGLGRDFYEAGPGHLTQRLEAFLVAAQAKGAIRPLDPHLLAGQFLASLRVHLDIADTFSRASRPVADPASVHSVVDLFVAGIDGGKQPC